MGSAKLGQERWQIDDAERLNRTDVQLTAEHSTETGDRVAACIDSGETGSSGR
jgi:hypothetical protein